MMGVWQPPAVPRLQNALPLDTPSDVCIASLGTGRQVPGHICDGNCMDSGVPAKAFPVCSCIGSTASHILRSYFIGTPPLHNVRHSSSLVCVTIASEKAGIREGFTMTQKR